MSFFVLDDSTAEAKMPILLTRVDRNLRMPYGSGPHPYSGFIIGGVLDRAACIMHLFVCEITVSQLCLGSTRSIALIVLQAMKEAETFNTVSYEQLQTIISDLALAYRLTQGSVLLQVLRTWHARGNLGAAIISVDGYAERANDKKPWHLASGRQVPAEQIDCTGLPRRPSENHACCCIPDFFDAAVRISMTALQMVMCSLFYSGRRV
ncbi:hypothetical protein M438DRAFT_358709 [Aureobasidium pullulans EXF-150]|uniref:Uncharacterized protein n=1 Tax=Aureobasidium pullulans EXF-150 TaxID=1043002 RepID=A0A074XEQ3_AURPU|nr:uncharacterized protein M438DRAFT_358709 [Aureobasidium pullulans EXF-150]KEQ80527.1 hypothetical protein M438DRAFT_358709 [Aureobasidium pullulans EXF-150]